jgi:hypothetical protein
MSRFVKVVLVGAVVTLVTLRGSELLCFLWIHFLAATVAGAGCTNLLHKLVSFHLLLLTFHFHSLNCCPVPHLRVHQLRALYQSHLDSPAQGFVQILGARLNDYCQSQPGIRGHRILGLWEALVAVGVVHEVLLPSPL